MAEPVRFQHFEVPLREDGSLHELGRGAMGITYKAFDTNLRCFVALKVINTAFLGSDVARQRFLREARAAAALRHPNVAAVFHLGEEGPDCFYAMEYVDGETVEAMMKREGALAATTALEVVLQVSRALGAAHKHGLVHRDIKPSNLMIAREDGEFTVKVIDFGLAKNTGAGEGESEATLTMGGFLGTPHFASPEQLDERDLDVRSDIYSLGVTLYYMLAGRAPFSGSMAQVMSQHLHREPPLESLSDQPVQVVDLLRHMLAKDPAARPQTPGDLRREVEACLAAARSLPSAAPAEIAAPENFETQALDEPPGAAAVEVVPGAEFAGHYRIQNETRFSKLGKVFKAERVETSEPVSLVVLDSALVSSAEACTRIENQVVALQQIGESALQKILSLERFDHISFLTLEWVEGPNLLDLLRARKALPLAEALAILRPLAFGFDALCPAGLPCPDIAVHDVLVPGIDVWQPVPAEVAVKFNALSPGVGEASPGATLVTSSLAMMRESGSFSGSEERAFVFTLASLAYDLLGGIRSGSSSGAPVPVAGLTEMANTAVRRALSPASSSFSSCAVFLDALEGLRMPEEEEEIPEEDFAGQSALPVHVLAPPVIHQPAEPATRLLNRPVFWIAAGAVGVLFASGLALHYFRPPSASHGGIPSPSPSACSPSWMAGTAPWPPWPASSAAWPW
ncbi:MAG: serine/threonine-protein kinase [Verrucomicrobiota bacterium]